MYKELFVAALPMESPFYLESLNFYESTKRLDIQINFKMGTRFPESGNVDLSDRFPVYDTVEKIWRDLNFF